MCLVTSKCVPKSKGFVFTLSCISNSFFLIHFLINQKLNQNILNFMFLHRGFDRSQCIMISNVK